MQDSGEVPARVPLPSHWLQPVRLALTAQLVMAVWQTQLESYHFMPVQAGGTHCGGEVARTVP